MTSKEKSITSGLTFEEIKEIHKNDTSKEALDQLHRLSLIPDYVKPKSVEEKYRRLLRDKVLKDLEDYEELKKIMGTPIQEIRERLKILEILKKPMFYSERKKLGEEYIEWARENNASQNDLTNIITWCFCFKMKEWLVNEQTSTKD